MSLCIGIDFSTKRVDLAAIPLGLDARGGPWRVSVPRDKSEQLIAFGGRAIDEAMLRIGYLAGYDAALAINPEATVEQISHSVRMTHVDIISACLEKPAGRHVHPSLWELYGALGANLLRRCHAVTGLYPVEWRTAIGLEGRAKNSKEAGNERVRDLYTAAATWDEHELDALGIATAWRLIQWEAIPA